MFRGSRALADDDARVDRATLAGVLDAARGDRVHEPLLPRSSTFALKTLLVTGPVGSGKTTVLLELGEVLEERGEAYALVDLDWLSWASAPRATPHELLLENLRSVATTFGDAGVELLVMCRYLKSREELDSLGDIVGELSTVALEAPRAVVEARVRARDTGRELAHHLEALAEDPPDLGCPVVDATGEPREIALAVLASAGW